MLSWSHNKHILEIQEHIHQDSHPKLKDWPKMYQEL